MQRLRVGMNRQNRLVCLAVIGGWVFAQAASAGPFIVKDGEARAEIVIAEQPPRAVDLAASDLQRFIEQMTGATLPVVAEPTDEQAVTIYVGQSPHTRRLEIDTDGLEAGAFRMVSGESWLALIGHDSNYEPREPYARTYDDKERVLEEWDAITGETWRNSRLSVYRQYSPSLDLWELDERGSLNSVYQFLRDQGMRWYFPGKLGQVIPKRKDIALPSVDKTVAPDFAVRDLFIYYAEFFAARPGVDNDDEVRWQLWLGLRAKQMDWGFSGGHGLVALTGREEVQKRHPEFYALWGGKRAFETARYGAQCLSAEGLFEQNLEYARTLLDHYDEPMISAGPGDSYVSLCQCELCEGKATSERGWNGQLSDYVWGYVNRLAKELYKTHPDRKVSCIAYSTYQLPPTQIDQLSPNVALIFCRWRSQMHDPEAKAAFRELLNAWLTRLPSKELYTWDYYRHGVPGSAYEGVPVYFPHAIAEDLRYLKGLSKGEYIEVYGNRNSADQPWHALATMHLNCYVTARLWWDAEQDIDALLNEYYEKFYGPAQQEMKAFIAYAEANWMNANKDHQVIDRMFELIDAAQAATSDSVYSQRVALVAEYMHRLHQLRDRLAKGRDDNPKVRALGRGKSGIPPIELDGKLDDKFWDGVPAYSLRRLQTGAQPHYATWFRMAWRQETLYVAIHCKDRDTEGLNIAAREHDDTNIWNGNVVEILLETQVRDYYQIAISPAGAVVDLDRSMGFGMDWSANAEVASAIGEDGWTVEVCLPIVAEGQADVDPLNGIAGRKPTSTYPWYFNICRQRVGAHSKEMSAFSPTGKPDFHDPMKFAELIVP